MRFPTLSALALTSVACHAEAFRNVLYIDEWHPNITTNHNDTAGITHVIMAFVDPTNFTTNDNLPSPPLMPVEQVRARFDNGTKIGIALGGWGESSSSFAAVAAKENRTTFASNFATWMKDYGYDFVDIDWEYPGGNGAVASANPKKEIADFPGLIKAIKSELKNQSVGSQSISLSVAGTTAGMAAFQSVNQTRPIWDNIEFITVMAYDYVNRASNATGHHSDVEGTKLAIQRYIDLGLCPGKINLGFAFYAKYFQVDGSCGNSTLPTGCPIMKAQTENGTDLYTSGVLTFEYRNLYRDSMLLGALQESPDGSCGWSNGNLTTNKCKDSFCCAEAGWCGDTPQHCMLNCQVGYGKCEGPDIITSFEKAQLYGMYDDAAGGMWYLDETTEPNLFWTWESVKSMRVKFWEIVMKGNATLGGISGWSFGEDTARLEHIKEMRNMTLGMNGHFALWQ